MMIPLVLENVLEYVQTPYVNYYRSFPLYEL